MLKKIYQELEAIRKELQSMRKGQELSKGTFVAVREPYSRNYRLVEVEKDHKSPNEWRRFEDITESAAERSRLERVIEEHCLSRQDLAVILFGLRVRPGFEKKDFGI